MTIWEDRFSDRQAPTGGTSKWLPQLGVRGSMPPGVRRSWGVSRPLQRACCMPACSWPRDVLQWVWKDAAQRGVHIGPLSSGLEPWGHCRTLTLLPAPIHAERWRLLHPWM